MAHKMTYMQLCNGVAFKLKVETGIVFKLIAAECIEKRSDEALATAYDSLA